MNDSRAFAALIERERDAVLADWQRRAQALRRSRRAALTRAEEPTPPGGGRANCGAPANAPETQEAAAWLAGVVSALQDASGVASDLGDDRDAPRTEADLATCVDDVGALRGTLHDLAAARGLVLRGRALEVVNRALDDVICHAVLGKTSRRATASPTALDEVVLAAHDFKSPLNAIALAVDVLESVLPSASDGETPGRMLRSIRRSVDQLSALTKQMLEASPAAVDKPLAPARRRLELRPLVDEVVRELEPLARLVGARVVNAVPETLVVHADGDLLGRVFQNLVANAIDHAPGGEIIVGAEVSSGEGSVVCWVRDDGTGIAPHEVEQILRSGASARANHGSRGLGLPIVERVVKAHGGRIAVESAAGFGATFWFELPAAERAQSAHH